MFRSIIAFFIVLLTLLLTAPLAADTCPAGTGNVAVDFVRDGNADPIIPSSNTTRAESARISSALRDALGITVVAPGGDINPQIRVVIDAPLLPDAEVSTALFTVQEVFTDAAS